MPKNKLIEDNYIFPAVALKKLNEAKRYHTPIYIYGVTGLGKTSLVKHALVNYTYYSAADTTPDMVREKEMVRENVNVRKDSCKTVIIDDLQSVSVALRESWKEQIESLLVRKDIWLILIARCPFPRWLLTLRTRYVFAEISESELLFSIDEQKQYLDNCGLHLTAEQNKMAYNVGKGNPISLVFFIMEKGNIEATKKRLWDYLEYHVYDQWDIELQELFMDISVVDRFTIKLASMLAGRNDVGQLIAEAELLGDFFTIHGDDGIWECRWEMRHSMLQKLHRYKTQDYIDKLYYKAGLYYELKGDIPEALAMYEKYKDMESISRLLVINARKDPSSGHYYELRKYYLELPDSIIEKDPVLMTGMSLLQSMLLNVNESERWYNKLEEYASSHTGSLKKEAKGRLLFLKISLGHRGSVDMLDILKGADVIIRDKKAALPELSVTSNLPSILNGGKDFSQWTKHDTELAASFGKILAYVLGRIGKGLVPLALAESYLEKGGDNYKIFSLAEKGKMEADSGGRIEQVFVGVSILSWLSVFNNDCDTAQENMYSFRERAVSEAPRLIDNIDAMICRINLYQGKDVHVWMQTAPDERKEFSIMERFRYLTKVRVYISMQQYEAAYCLVQQLRYYADIMKRTYIDMELDMLQAIIEYNMHNEHWLESINSCISKAEDYHFIRLITREGALIEPLLKDDRIIWNDNEFMKSVLTECSHMSSIYPAYPGKLYDNINISDNAVRILKYQAEGLSASAIADKLNISEATVKYHTKETYRKLSVNNKTAAIEQARKRGLI